MDSTLLILRLVMGLAMAAHGSQKLFGWFGGGGIEGTGAYLESIGFHPSRWYARTDGLGEFFGGLLLALGFLNPAGPALMVSVMLVAILTVHEGHGFFTITNGPELPVLYITGALMVAFSGPGLYSLDYLLGLNWIIPQTAAWIALGLAELGSLGTVAMRRTVEQPAASASITPETVLEIFKGLENGDGAAFFEHVADNVDWTVMGTHPLAGHYLNKKSFIAGTFARLGQVLPDGAELHTEHLMVKDNQAAIELHSLATARNGMRFDNYYCWVVDFRDGQIVRVRAYLDSAMVARLFEENPVRDLLRVS